MLEANILQLETEGVTILDRHLIEAPGCPVLLVEWLG